MSLPKKIFVKRAIEGKETYLIALDNAEDFEVQNETISVGIYELKKVIKVKNSTTIEE